MNNTLLSENILVYYSLTFLVIVPKFSSTGDDNKMDDVIKWNEFCRNLQKYQEKKRACRV